MKSSAYNIIFFGVFVVAIRSRVTHGQVTDATTTEAVVTCVGGSPPITDYVEATRSAILEGPGCVSREVATSPNQGKSVYVLLLDDSTALKKRRSVTLNISPSKDGRKQSILILASSQPMLWKLHSTSRVKLNIVVSNVTRVHKDGSIVDVMTHASVPADSQQLLQWVRQQYGGVTAFAAIQSDTNTIALILQGDVSSRPARCTPVSTFKSPVIVATNISPATVTGCVTRSHTGGRDVYVVELTSNTLTEVVVRLQGGGEGTPVSRHLVLILHSHGNWRTDPTIKKTRWVVMTTSDVRGEIDIITEGSVDTSGVTMHTVRVVNGERLETYSGASLVQWATATYGGPPFTYMATEHANRLSIVITHDEEDTGDGDDDADVVSSDSLLNQHTVLCEDTHMVVTLPRTQATASMVGRLTLMDPLCTAIYNDTHYVLRSGYEQCGSTVTRDGSIENAIVLRGGEEEASVAGGGRLGQGQDESLSVTFACPQPPSVAASYQQQAMPPAYTLQSCDANYDVCGEKVIERMQAGDRLHVQANVVPVSSQQRVLVDSCWLSATQSLAEMPLTWLIVKSCKTEASLQWHDSQSTSGVRFSFTVDPSMAVTANSRPVYIHCRLTLCHLHPMSDSDPQCKTREQYCIRTPGIQYQTILTTSTSLGPISIERGKPLASSSSSSSSRCSEQSKQVTTVVGADTQTVIVIAFAAFAIGILFTGVMWLIHAHTGQRKSCASRAPNRRPYVVAGSGESTPSSTAPLAVHHVKPSNT